MWHVTDPIENEGLTLAAAQRRAQRQKILA
jgi:hypothetical protein